jgi:hypothetical protein
VISRWSNLGMIGLVVSSGASPLDPHCLPWFRWDLQGTDPMKTYPAVRFLAPIVVALVLGPLIVSIALWLANVASDLFNGTSSTLADEGGFFVFLVIMAYVIGWPIALLAGVLVSLSMIRRPPSLLAVNGAAVIATAIFIGVAASGVLGPVEETNGRSNFWFTLVAAAFAANACWFGMRRFLRPASTDAVLPANGRPSSS